MREIHANTLSRDVQEKSIRLDRDLVKKGVEIDHLFYNKINELPLKPLFLDNILILIKIIAKMTPRFQHPS